MKHLKYLTRFSPTKDLRINKNGFRDALLHPEYGLRVTIFNNKANGLMSLILRPNSVNIEPFLKSINDNTGNRQDDGMQFIQDVLKSMDTEWDKKCASVLLGLSRSREKCSI